LFILSKGLETLSFLGYVLSIKLISQFTSASRAHSITGGIMMNRRQL